MGLELHIVTAILGNCTFDDLNDPRRLQDVLEESAQQASMTVLETLMKRFHPFGVTGVSILSQSHIAIHTWPERGEMFVDIATCSTEESADAALQSLLALLQGSMIVSRHKVVEVSSKPHVDVLVATRNLLTVHHGRGRNAEREFSEGDFPQFSA